jgi:hypothetical protein
MTDANAAAAFFAADAFLGEADAFFADAFVGDADADAANVADVVISFIIFLIFK